jgi:hypothetical protein
MCTALQITLRQTGEIGNLNPFSTMDNDLYSASIMAGVTIDLGGFI